MGIAVSLLCLAFASSAMAWRGIGRSRVLVNLLNKWPGRNLLGVYRFLPLFYGLGAALEFSMINWNAGEVNFYKSFKKKRAHELALQRLGLA